MIAITPFKPIFFFYGTLIDPDVRRLVIGYYEDDAEMIKARLPGYSVLYANGARYPVLVSRPGRNANGYIVTGLPASSIKKLDQFEGSHYRREKRICRLSSGRALAAFVYIPQKSLPASNRPWQYEVWCEQDKTEFMRSSGLEAVARRLGAEKLST